MSDLPALAEAMANGDIDTMRALHEQAKRELEVFERLPCNGRLAPPPREERDPRYVVDCTNDYACRCIMRDNRGCPRKIREARSGLGTDTPIERRSELRRLGVPDETAAFLVSKKIDATNGINAVKQFLADREQRLLVLSGGARVGKTCAAGFAVSERSTSAAFVLAGKLGELARDRQQWDRLRAIGLLAVDDASTEFHDEKGWMSSVWDNLIVTRYDSGLQTLLTTNKSVKTFAEIYGERIAKRVHERGRFLNLGRESAHQVVLREPGEDG